MTPRESSCSSNNSRTNEATTSDGLDKHRHHDGGRSESVDDVDDADVGIPTKDIFLTSEERYQIWMVKSAERPELLANDEYHYGFNNVDGCSNEDDNIENINHVNRYRTDHRNDKEDHANNGGTLSDEKQDHECNEDGDIGVKLGQESAAAAAAAAAITEDGDENNYGEEMDHDDDDEDDDDDKEVEFALPLTDGCDIPGWRSANLVPLKATNCTNKKKKNRSCLSKKSSLAAECYNDKGAAHLGSEGDSDSSFPNNDHDMGFVSSALHVGQGCTLLRLESQLPVLSTRYTKEWESLRQKFLTNLDCRSKIPKRISYKNPSKTTNDDDHNHTITLPLHSWFERENVPVIIDGCTDDWDAMESCTFERLVQRFGHLEWRFSDTHGETMTLHTYNKYLNSIEGQTDDAPLAIYDSQFGTTDDDDDDDNDERACIINEYTVPTCFRTDLFELLDGDENSDANNNGGENDDKEDDEEDTSCYQRPPYRWILIGPARSGTGLHIDPIGTHAWVTLVQGCKRWVLFPAGTAPESIGMQSPQIPSVIWFRDHYDRIMPNHPGAVEVIQYPGETVYVPAGWPHLVLNLELSVAITHNYATHYPSLDRLYNAIEESEPHLLNKFQQRLRRHRPDVLLLSEKNNNS